MYTGPDNYTSVNVAFLNPLKMQFWKKSIHTKQIVLPFFSYPIGIESPL